MFIAGDARKPIAIVSKTFSDFLLQKVSSHGIFKHLLTKGRPNWRISQLKR
jgi:hypothetical protein